MTSIGVRELRQRASEFLRRVEAGETLEVTDRGRPIALLTPIPQAPPLEQLRASGEIVEARGGIVRTIPLVPGVSTTSLIQRIRSTST
jgi:prevent-host-death family protein